MFNRGLFQTEIDIKWEQLEKMCEYSIDNFNNRYAGEILAYCLSDIIILDPNLKDRNYIYDDTTKLWQKVSKKVLETSISSSILEHIFKFYWKQNTPNVKSSKNVLTKCGQQSFTKPSWAFAESILTLKVHGNSHYIKLDSDSDLIPLSNEQIYDFQLQSIRPRTKEDYFTYCLPVSYADINREIKTKIRDMLYQICGDSDDTLAEFLNTTSMFVLGPLNTKRILIFHCQHSSIVKLLTQIIRNITIHNEHISVLNTPVRRNQYQKLLSTQVNRLIVITTNVPTLDPDLAEENLVLNLPATTIGNIYQDTVEYRSSFVSLLIDTKNMLGEGQEKKEGEGDEDEDEDAEFLDEFSKIDYQNSQVGHRYDKFIDECCHVNMDDDNLKCNVSTLYTSFRDWFTKIYPGITCPKQKEFRTYMLEAGFEQHKNNMLYYLHIDLRSGNKTVPLF